MDFDGVARYQTFTFGSAYFAFSWLKLFFAQCAIVKIACASSLTVTITRVRGELTAFVLCANVEVDITQVHCSMSWSSLELTMPAGIATALDMLGQISIPLLLFTLGVRLIDVDFSAWRIGVLGAILCPAAGILLALLLQPLLQLESEQFAYLLLFGALPPAVLNYIVAEQFNQEPKQVASIVLIGNIGALLFIPATLYFVLR